MKKILNNNKDLLQKFISDKNALTQKELVQKYDVSQATISRLLKQFNSQNNSIEQLSEISEQEQNDSKSYSNEQNETKNDSNEQESVSNEQKSDQNEQEQSQQNSIQNNEQSEQSLQVQKSFIENQNYSLIEYLNEEQQPKEKNVEQKQFVEQRNYQKNNNNYKKQSKQQQPQQQIEQVNINPESDEQKQNKINNYMIKIREIIQFFKDEQSIHHIIGSTQNQQQNYVNNLYNKNLEQIEFIHKTIQFELMFSRSNDFMENTIETIATFAEKMLLVANINVIGCYNELKQDEEFIFYYKMLMADNCYVAIPKQIIFMKFIKNYYMKYNQNKQMIKTEQNLNLNKKIDLSLLEKFQNL